MMIGLLVLTSLAHLQALTPEQELRACKPALIAALNGHNRLEAKGCPVSQKLIYWLGISRKPELFTPKELIGFLSAHSHWPFYEKLCEKAEKVLHKKASQQDILTWFKKHPPKTPEGATAYAKALLAKGEKAKALHEITKAWQTMEMTQGQEKKFLSDFGRMLSEKHHFARLQFLLWDENITDARRHLARVSNSVQKAARLRISFLQGDSPQLPSSLKDEGLLYEKVRWLKKQKDFYAAAQILIKTPTNRKHAQKWWKERSYVAREMIALQDYQKAYQILKKHNLEAKTEAYAEAEWLLGWLALRFLKKPHEALHHFMALGKQVEGAVSKARAAYWVGRTYETQRKNDLAEKYYRIAARYKTAYYGQLSAAKLQENPYPILNITPKVTALEKKRFHEKDLVKAAYILKGLGKEAAHEISKFLSPIATQAKTKAERELAVQLAHHLSPCDVVWIAKRAGNREPVLLKTAFPTCSLPTRKDLPESALLHAIAYKESHFNPKAESSKGAQGLLQLIPKAAAEAAERLGISHSAHKIFDPAHNLLLGSDHLSTLLTEFNGSYILAIAAYNAGPTPVRRWLKEFGDPRDGKIDVIDWIERVPYGETRNYLMRVLETLTNYRSRSGKPHRTIIDDLTRPV
jgi:soluble lytic murein transglycosylase